jgi:hypothetical protein
MMYVQSLSTGGTIFWKELHSTITTNDFGLFTLVIGTGTRQIESTVATFDLIDWSVTPKYLKTQIYYDGSWKEMGTSQLLAVPYAMTSGDIAGTIDKLAVKGTTSGLEEALFEVKNKDGQTVFAVYNEGVRIYVSNGAKAVKGGFAVGGFGTDKAESTKYLFVGKDSVRIYLDMNPLTKGKKSGFAVGGYDLTKGIVQDYLDISADSVRVYIDSDPEAKKLKGGFAVGGYDMTKGVLGDYFNVSGKSEAEVINGEPRVLWYPAKEAFRSGNVLIESKDSVGLNSWASGYRSKAIGEYSQGMGYQSIARGSWSTAIGYQSVASGSYSTAIGNKSKSKGLWSFAIGRDSRAYGTASTAMGDQARAFGESSVALGCYSKSNGYGSAAVGYQSITNGEFSTTIGMMTSANGDRSIAMGSHSISTGDISTAMGSGSKSIGDISTAIGDHSYAKSFASFAIGRYNDTTCISSTSWDTSDPLFMAGNGTATTLSNAFIVYKNGNVYVQSNLGIGAANPSKKMEIGGTSSSVFFNSATSNLLEYNMQGVAPPSYNTRSNGTKIALYPGVSATTAEYALGIDASTFWMSVPNNTGTFKFYAGTSEIMRITGHGNVGIGTNSPGNKLDVNGTIRANSTGTPSTGAGVEIGYITGSNYGYILGYDRGASVYRDLRLGGNILPNSDNLFTLGASGVRWVSVWSVNGTIQTSDMRLKDNIISLNYGLESIMKLNPVCFTWKDDANNSKHLGLVAQDVIGIIKEVVETGTDPDNMLGINYSQLVPVLIKGMQEQQQQIESTQQENQLLKSELQSLKNKMDRIEGMLAKGDTR